MARRRKDDPGAPELSHQRIVSAAIELIDLHGLEAFSLRGLARHIEAGNMSVYYYVKDRDALLAMVLDEILGSISLKRLPADPIDALATLSQRFVTAFVNHPGTIPLFVLRPLYSIGPHGQQLFDRFVGLLRETGVADRTVADTTVALIEYLCGHLIGHLPQVRHPHDNHGATVDEMLQALPDGAAPNLRAIGPALRRAVEDLRPTAGITLILSGLTSQNTIGPKP